MAIGSKGLTPADLDGMDNERLSEELSKAKAELFNLRFASATGQLEDHGRLKAVRRDIARIYTIVRERELGIRTAPSTECLDRSDWRVNANANQGYSLGGMMLNTSGKVVANYWLSQVYSAAAGQAAAYLERAIKTEERNAG